MTPNTLYLIASLSLPLLFTFARHLLNRREERLAFRLWCVKHLAGERRKVGELFEENWNSHHIT